MRGNPFDESLSPSARERLQQVQALRKHPEGTEELCAHLHRHRARIRASWQEDQDNQHHRILDQAVEREEARADFEPTPSPEERSQREAADDQAFAHVQDRGQLMELRDDQLYLRGHRALERRAQRLREQRQQEQQAQATPEEPEETPRVTGRLLWGLVSGILAGFVLLHVFSQSFGAGLVATPFLFLGWLGLFRLPVTYIGTFSGGGARSGRASGNYV